MADVTEQETKTNQGEGTTQIEIGSRTGTVDKTSTPGDRTTTEFRPEIRSTSVSKAHVIKSDSREELPVRVTDDHQGEKKTVQVSTAKTTTQTAVGTKSVSTSQEDIGFQITFTLPLKNVLSKSVTSPIC